MWFHVMLMVVPSAFFSMGRVGVGYLSQLQRGGRGGEGRGRVPQPTSAGGGQW